MGEAQASVRGYVICGVARSGTTYLCELLRSTGLLGKPREIFNPGAFWDVPGYPLEPEAQLQALSTHGVTPNGVYGLKTLTDQFAATAALRWVERLPQLSFVYLRREDLLGLAISNYRAYVSGAWTSRMPAGAEPTYDPVTINSEMVAAVRGEARWRYWFAHNGIVPLQLRYEDVVGDPQGAVDAIAAMMGVEHAQVDVARFSWLKIQRDATTDLWRERFLAENRSIARFD